LRVAVARSLYDPSKLAKEEAVEVELPIAPELIHIVRAWRGRKRWRRPRSEVSRCGRRVWVRA
jgi:hypothetical protein